MGQGNEVCEQMLTTSIPTHSPQLWHSEPVNTRKKTRRKSSRTSSPSAAGSTPPMRPPEGELMHQHLRSVIAQSDSDTVPPLRPAGVVSSGSDDAVESLSADHVDLPPLRNRDNSFEHWKRGNRIGRGAHGDVYFGLNMKTGDIFAVKVLPVDAEGADPDAAGSDRHINAEVEVLSKLEHPNIVRYFGSLVRYPTPETREVLLFLEYVPGGSLASLLARFGKFSTGLSKKLLQQVVVGVAYLHDEGVVHRDLKCENILLDKHGVVKVADFGSSKFLRASKSFIGTPSHMAPEVILGHGHTYRSDIWSLGCTLLELLTAKRPYAELRDMAAVLYTIGHEKKTPLECTDVRAALRWTARDTEDDDGDHSGDYEERVEQLIEIMDVCLQYDAHRRPTAAQLLESAVWRENPENGGDR